MPHRSPDHAVRGAVPGLRPVKEYVPSLAVVVLRFGRLMVIGTPAIGAPVDADVTLPESMGSATAWKSTDATSLWRTRAAAALACRVGRATDFGLAVTVTASPGMAGLAVALRLASSRLYW